VLACNDSARYTFESECRTALSGMYFWGYFRIVDLMKRFISEHFRMFESLSRAENEPADESDDLDGAAYEPIPVEPAFQDRTRSN
jgi:hypothetical protein